MLNIIVRMHKSTQDIKHIIILRETRTRTNNEIVLYSLACTAHLDKDQGNEMPPSRNHTFPIRNSHLSPLLTPALQLDWGIAIRLHIREQNSTSLITDAFQSRHHYIFKPLSFKNVTKKTFLPAPVGTLSSSTLMILLVSSLPLPTAKNTLLCNSRL